MNCILVYVYMCVVYVVYMERVCAVNTVYLYFTLKWWWEDDCTWSLSRMFLNTERVPS